MPVLVRRAALTDRQNVFELTKSFAMTSEPTADVFAASFAELIARDDTLLIVAEETARVLGYLLAFDRAALMANGHVCWIEEITASADRRRQGIGRELMQACEAWARERNARMIALATRRASEFYVALGYEASATYFRKIL